MSKIKISQGRIIDPAYAIDQISDLYIVDNNILCMGQVPNGFQADIDIDATGQIVCPGFIDLSARLREPGHTQKADINSETKAAAAAGITGLCMPPDTHPILDTPAVAELIKDKAELAGYAHVYPIAALTQALQGKELSAMFTLKQAGCIAVSNARQPINNLLVLHRAMEYAASHDLLLIFKAQDDALSNNGCAHDGEVATRYGLPAIPETAETIALAQCLELIQKNHCRVHFSQLSCARSVDLLQVAKANGLPVSADVAMHQLHLCEEDIPPFDSAYHLNPPLRSKQDQIRLRQAVQEGIIDAICSDHQPHDVDAKLGAFPETEAGMSALESLLPLMLKLVKENILTLQQGLQAISTNPAAILGLPAGNLQVGSPADLCIFKPEQNWTMTANNWHSRGQNTPFWGQQMTGKVTHTLQCGKVIYQ